MTAIHTYTCRFCGERFTEECPSINGRIIAPPSCEKCASEPDVGAVADARVAAPRAVDLDRSWPSRHHEALEGYHGPAREKAEVLWDRVLSRRACTLVLYGPRGRGKTGMAAWWAWKRGQEGQSPGIYATAYELFARIRRSWHPSSDMAEWDALKPYQRTPYLAIDQLHQCRALSAGDDKAALWERMALAELLDYRYRENRTTVLIATLETQEELRTAIDADILDRVKESGGVIHCSWPSYR